MVPCQSDNSQMEKMKVKDLGKLKSHKPQNPVKQLNKNLRITKYTLNDILNIIEQSHSEKNIMKGVKNNNPC